MKKAYKITGRVQGVGFRYRAREKATELGLCGYVQNLADGSVFCLCIGDAARIMLMEEWLNEGPPFASVDRVIPVDEFSGDDFDRFYIR